MKNKLKTIIIYALILILVLTAFSAAFAQTPPFVGSEYLECSVSVNGEKIKDTAYTIKGDLYISIDTLKKYGDCSKINIDTENNKITFDVSNLDLSIGDKETSDFIKNNAGECYVPIKSFNSDIWVSIASIAQIVKLTCRYSDFHIDLAQYSQLSQLALAGGNENAEASLGNSSVVALTTGERVIIKKETPSFYKVENMDGEVFYINKDEITEISASELADFEYIPTPKDTFDKPINLVWHNLADTAVRTPNPPAKEGGLRHEGIDVVSPPWMHQVVNGNGMVSHICDYGYVELAHSLGYKVWITANNLFTTLGSTAYTTKVMSSEELSNKVIAQYLFYACLYNADGINIDYEDLLKADRSIFAGFMEKIAGYCDKLGLVCAVDTSIPTSYNTMYDWDRLGKACDYVIPMTYVEHMGSSVGSVSSYSWYSYYMDSLKTMVPAEKILMGVPFFTRYYRLDSAGKITKSATITMTAASNWVNESNASVIWNESEGQYIAEWKENGQTVTLWMEEERSIQKRIDYVKEAGLGGSACWAVEQAGEGILEMFDRGYNE